MRSFALCALLAALPLGCKKAPPTAAPPADPPGPTAAPTSDKDRFQGVWKLTTFDKGDGPKSRPERVAVMVFKGDKLTYHESATEPGDTLAVAWDETKSPKVLALKPLTPDGKPMPGAPDEL